MPAPRTDLDREAIAASIALKGIRATSRDLNLPASTVQDIARAGNVAVPTSAFRTVCERVTAVASARSAQKPAHALITEELARLGSESRLSAAKYAHHTLAYASDIARNDPEVALAAAGDVKSVVGIAQGANVPGFERQEASGSQTVVNIALLGMPPEPMIEHCLELPEESILPGTVDEWPNPSVV